MARHSRRTLTKAEARFRELVDELKLLTLSFPHLKDSFDEDELPVSFILKRGADRADAKVARVRKRAAGTSDRPAAARRK